MQMNDFPATDGVAETPTRNTDDTSALITLYNRTVDSVNGFVTMAEKAEPSFRDTAERFRALHARHADMLARILADHGVNADANGSIMGLVNQAVVTFRAFFDEIDEDVMDQVRSGEDWVLQAFDAAMEEQPSLAPTLHKMRDELTCLLSDTRNLG